mmetsp:Transcript_64226/g.153163  ORF Transcript_64226/g.153163 Transcript_64226/m.153163 type:complete len:406 (-) Transcript_64226:79-1296(-)
MAVAQEGKGGILTRGRVPNSLVLSGFLLLIILMIIPVWESASLLWDFNYVYWAGSWEPQTIILLCACVLCGYVAAAILYSIVDPEWTKHDSSTAFFVHMFVSMVGLVYLFGALGLMKQANTISMNLMDHCAHSDASYSTFLYSQVLHRMRRRPGCDEKMSVEECEGFTPVQPYLDYLRNAELTFRCSGFCYEAPGEEEMKAIEEELEGHVLSRVVSAWPWPREPNASLAPAPSAAPKPPYLARAPSPADYAAAPSGSMSLAQAKATPHFLHQGAAEQHAKALPPAPAPAPIASAKLPASLLGLAAATGDARKGPQDAEAFRVTVSKEFGGPTSDKAKIVWNYTYAPTLFSRANFPLSCHGMAARDLTDHAGSYGELLCFQGLVLIAGASFAYVLKVIRICIRKDF